MKLPFKVRKPILACGADLKGAFALAKGSEAFLCEGFGDLSDLGNFQRYKKAIAKAIKTTGIKPDIIAHDMHPGYFSTRFAEFYTLNAKRYVLYAVQHHEAHIASCIVDNNIKGSVIGVAFDGTGYGTDGNIWGGEFFIGSLKGFRRAAHLEYVAMPGADAAVRQPWRMTESYRYAAVGKCKNPIIKKMIDRRINSPLTSSAGRLFDAIASLVLGRKKADFEAELPIEFEKIAATNCEDIYKYITKPEDCPNIIKSVIADIHKGVDKAVISARFHNTVGRMIAKTVSLLGKNKRVKNIVLSGGVFQNRYLTGKIIKYMDKSGLNVYRHTGLPTTDSGIPVGQIAITQARYLCV
ncbi:MAG: hypothetical protein NTZ95_02115 [Candidatus Omnitrophica bacterium]|nr:hypothetical protein [Candidatus Omnitrophota bacterium]